MTVREKAPTVLTREGARRLTGKIRDALALADDLLVKAYEGRIWEVTSYPDFAAWCAGELPEMRTIKLRAPARRARAAKLLEHGASEREIAAATGASSGTAHNDVAFLTGRSILSTPPPAEVQVSVLRRKTDWVVLMIEAAGPSGLDVRAVQAALGCERNEASATLTRLHAAGRVGYVAPVRRGLFGRYVAPR